MLTNHKPDVARTKIEVKGLCCASEISLVRGLLEPLPGVQAVNVNIVNKTVLVHHDQTTKDGTMVQLLNKKHLNASLVPEASGFNTVSVGIDADVDNEEPDTNNKHHCSLKLPARWNVLLGTVLWIVSLFQYLNTSVKFLQYFAIGAIAVAMPPLILRAWGSLQRRIMDVNALLTIAVVGAIALGEYAEGAAVVVLFSLGEWLEYRATNRARNEIKAIIALRPLFAILAPEENLSTVEEMTKVPVESVKIGTNLLVRTGDKVPLDGVVLSGSSLFDESSLTGESKGVSKDIGDQVNAGTVNSGTGMVVMQSTALSSDSAVARLARLIEDAQAQRSPTEQLVERLSSWYTPFIVLIAILLASVPWAWGSQVGQEYLQLALFLLVVACPCALVISTPIAYTCTIAHAARIGCLVKGGKYLETLGVLDKVAFDKTGTLTEGKFELASWEVLPSFSEESEWCPTPRSVLGLVALVEAGSNHPIGVALCKAAIDRQSNTVAAGVIVESQEYLPGKGLSAVLFNQTQNTRATLTIGNSRLTSSLLKKRTPSVSLDERAERGETVGWVAINETIVATFGVADKIRDEAKEAIQMLHDLGIETVMLTGDNNGTAKLVAKQVGIGSYFAELLPDEKVDHISRQSTEDETGRSGCCQSTSPQSKKKNVAMVGDGVNDGPALARADVGLAMGAMGTAVSMETADISLMDSDLRKISKLVRLGKKCRTKIKQNILFSIVSKFCILVLVLFGVDQLWIAILSDVGAMLIVTLNGLTLLGNPRK